MMRRLCHMLILLLLPVPAAVAQTGRAEAPGRSLADEALTVLATAYPELQQGRIEWAVEATGGRLVLVARQRLSPFEAIAPDAPMLLRARIALDERGRLRAMDIDGPAARSEALAAARASPATQRDPEAGLRAARARITPSATEESEALVTDGLRRVLKIVHAESPRFAGAAASRALAAATEAAPLTWEAAAVGKDDDGRDVSYTLTFEPFAGRLVSVVRR